MAMKIKRIQAIDMPTALEKVRARHGADAVIISTRDLGADDPSGLQRGIELMVGIEERTASLSGRVKAAARAAASAGARSAYAGSLGMMDGDADSTGRAITPALSRLPRIERDDDEAALIRPGAEPFAALLNRATGLVSMPEPALGANANVPARQAPRALTSERPAPTPLARTAPQQAAQQAYELLRGVGLADGLVEEALEATIRLMPQRALGDCARLLEVALSRVIAALPEGPALTVEELAGKAVIFAGQAGVGKTTALLKAAVYLREAGGDVGIVGADVSHIGALDQLVRYGQLLRLPVEVAYTPDELSEILAAAPAGRITLVDTPACRPGARLASPPTGAGAVGRGPAIQRGQAGALGAAAGDDLLELLAAAPNRVVVLTVAATAGQADLKRLAMTARTLGAVAIAVTKLDDAAPDGGDAFSAGPALNVLAHLRLPALLCSTGRDVLADLRLASAADLAVAALEEAAGGRPSSPSLPPIGDITQRTI
ncbi:MAG TPA: hypothetical protein VFD32_16980 [Dehalococcoidia bacterium]|nr:hypothetical protein [Dehalococcoidia bacterium]